MWVLCLSTFKATSACPIATVREQYVLPLRPGREDYGVEGHILDTAGGRGGRAQLGAGRGSASLGGEGMGVAAVQRVRTKI